MRELEGLVLHKEMFNGKPLEVCKRYLSPDFDNLNSEIVFVVDKGSYFSVYKSIEAVINDSDYRSFDLEEDLNAYLKGTLIKSDVINEIKELISNLENGVILKEDIPEDVRSVLLKLI
jgi:hypothetical protein